MVYWHISNSKKLLLPLNAANIKLYKEPGQEIDQAAGDGNSVTVPLEGRLFLKASNISKEQLIEAFNKATIKD